jgi:hypothetical protein
MSSNINKNYFGMRLVLQMIFAYLAVVVFILWACSVIESFIPCSWKWFLITMQILFVIKVAFIVSILLLPLFVIFGSKALVCIKAKE